MENQTLIYLELTNTSLLRFPLWVSKECGADTNHVFVYLTKSKKKADFSKLPRNSKIIYLKGDITRIKACFDLYSNSKLIVCALRPPEFYALYLARKKSVSSFLIQHGVFIPFMKREPFFFIQESKKLWMYVKSIYALSKETKVGLNKLLNEIFLIFIKGNKRISQSIYRELDCISDNAIVYSNYWQRYFIDNYGFEENQFYLMGTPDLEKFQETVKKPKLNAICYICQTLVEDGRLSKKEFIEFIDVLNNSLKEDQVLYIKTHPRTNLGLFKKLTQRKNTFISNMDVPHCLKYVGHYSTLLSLPLSITSDVFLWEFEKMETPEYFAHSTQFVSNKKENLKMFMEMKESHEPNDKIEYYFNKAGMRPFKIAARKILETK